MVSHPVDKERVARFTEEYGGSWGINHTMKILALGSDIPGVATEQFAPYLKPEAAQVWQLYQAGVIREMYFRVDRSDAVLMLECADADEAQRWLNVLPLVNQGLISFQLVPLKPYPGLARLFESKHGAPQELPEVDA